jgi:hypothetical protein
VCYSVQVEKRYSHSIVRWKTCTRLGRRTGGTKNLVLTSGRYVLNTIKKKRKAHGVDEAKRKEHDEKEQKTMHSFVFVQ